MAGNKKNNRSFFIGYFGQSDPREFSSQGTRIGCTRVPDGHA
jgi:hypothetical protein